VLTASYGLLIALTLLGVLPAVQPVFLVLSHLPIVALVWVKSSGIDLRKRSEVSRYYQFIWKLFFLEYLDKCSTVSILR
jgi:homogentisate phytyltransferase/homogentisate geranylgeranyltransferase